VVRDPGSKLAQKPHFISAPIPLDGARAPERVFVNAAGLDADSQIKVEILDEQFRPIAGDTNADAVAVAQDGFRQPAEWRSMKTLEGSEPIRVRLDFEGNRPEDIRLYAVYVATE
jgi:hypothetical protein